MESHVGAGADVSRPPAAVDAEATTEPFGRRRGPVPPQGRLPGLEPKSARPGLHLLPSATHRRVPANARHGSCGKIEGRRSSRVDVRGLGHGNFSTYNIDEYCAYYVYPMGLGSLEVSGEGSEVCVGSLHRARCVSQVRR